MGIAPAIKSCRPWHGAWLRESAEGTWQAGGVATSSACCFPGASAAEAAVSVERIRQSLESLIFSASDGSEYRVTGTVGVAGLVSGMSSEALLEAADRALYYAKQQGRNRIGDASFIAPFVASSKRSPQTQVRSLIAPFPKAEEPSASPP